MDKFRYFENESGFFIDYVFDDKNHRKCLRLSEDNDYFSFSLFSPDEEMMHFQVVNIVSDNPIYSPIKNILENKQRIEILEEGTSEGKSIILEDDNDIIKIIFKLANNPTHVASVSITNVRLSSPNVTFGENSHHIEDFKNKLNCALLEIKDILNENTM